ncbi:MAG TPA: glycosyltransferase family 4 protein, partial [Candidatus Saccharimonadales bacterium]|nr:glycosyltransferase family 4 protein [Candidatus Saccharimonadales bacterium]
NPVDIASFKPRGITNSENEIVFLGRLVKRKGCQQLIEAFSLLIEKLPKAKLTIVGDGPERTKLARLVNRLGLDGKVRFMGHISEDMKPQTLAKASVACFPSLYGESFGIVLIEAMAAGAGVVLGGDNPGYRTVLGDQPKLLINPRSTKAFASRLEELLNNRPVIDGLHAWQTEAVKQYDINIVGQRLLDIYNEQIARRPKKSNN